MCIYTHTQEKGKREREGERGRKQVSKSRASEHGLHKLHCQASCWPRLCTQALSSRAHHGTKAAFWTASRCEPAKGFAVRVPFRSARTQVVEGLLAVQSCAWSANRHTKTQFFKGRLCIAGLLRRGPAAGAAQIASVRGVDPYKLSTFLHQSAPSHTAPTSFHAELRAATQAVAHVPNAWRRAFSTSPELPKT